MVLSEEQKAEIAKKEKTAREQKKAEQELIAAQIKADRERFNEVHRTPAPQATDEEKPKLLVRLRYDIDSRKGRRPVELSGTPAELSLFHLNQAIQDLLDLPLARQILRPADESTWPLQPKDEMLPVFGSFASIDDMPSLETLGVRNGQEIFLTAAPASEGLADAVAAVPAVEPAPTAAPAPPAALEPSPAPAPAAKPAVQNPMPAPRPAPAPVPEPQAAASTQGRVQYSEEQRMKFVWRGIEDKKLALHRALEHRQNLEVKNARESQETTRLASLLLWSPDEIAFYARLRADLDSLIGLEPAKEFIVQRLRDAAGRHILKEGKQPHRHVLISGHFGVGKKYAAQLIGRLFALLSGNTAGGRVKVGSRVRLAAQSDSENRGALLSRMDLGVVTEELPPGNPKPIRVQGPSGRFGNYREEELVAENEVLMTLRSLSDLQDPKTQSIRVAEGTCYHLGLDAGATLSEADSVILDAILDGGSIVVMTGPQAVMEANMQTASFRRRQPDLIELPTLGPTELARMIAVAVEKKGYTGIGEGDVGTPQIVIVLENIVRMRFDDALIREKNAHLAKDILDLAISRKNDRTWMEPLESNERFRLTPTDFGLDVLTAEQREKRMQEVEHQVAGLVGWGKPDQAGSPRFFFVSLRQLPHPPRALWVTANPGAGADTFVQLSTRFLRACGVVSREEVMWANGIDLCSAGEGSIQTQLSSANRGCFAIRGAEAFADNRDALRDLVAALESAEASTMLIVLVGTPSGMARTARMEPALESRFTTHVNLPDFTADELVEFIELAAKNLPSGPLSIEEGARERLAHHIQETYGGGANGKELGERGNLGLARQLLQRAIQNRITRLFNRIQEGERPGDSPASECLVAGDFEIGAPLGEGEEQRKAIDQEVEDLIGMQKAKDWFAQVRQKVAFVERTGTRSDLRVCLNIIITGNPGTGKTTFARLLAKFFHTYGVLSKDSFVEKNGLELKAEYMGGTAPRVKAAVQEAKGGCLFLDEAYALIDSSSGVGGHGDVFSQEAMRTLLTEVENHRTQLMVVLAGYKDKMSRLMRADEGLARRFPSWLHLDDYSPGELARICELAARKMHQREFEAGLTEKLEKHIENFYWRDIAQQNAGLAINLTERALDRQIVRIVTKHPDAFAVPLHRSKSGSGGGIDAAVLMRQRSRAGVDAIKEEAALFTAADFGIEERPTLGDPELKKEIQAKVDSLIGMSNVKAFFKEMELSVKFVEKGGDPKVLQTSLNLQLTGNPGTGKTTVARLIAKYLHAHGVLPRDAFIERNALVLKGQFVGQTAPTVVEAVRDAMGGCLFIDEAYALVDRGGDKFSGEVVRTLLTEVENHRTGLLVVLAGYKDKMDVLMDSDPGLRRRFSLVLNLEDYSPEQLAEICEMAAQERFKLSFAPGLRDALAAHIQAAHGHEIKHANGGLAVTLAERAFRRLAMRIGAVGDGNAALPSGGISTMLLPEDFGIGTAAESKSAAPQGEKQKMASGASSGSQSAPRAKRLRKEWRDVVGVLAKDLAAQLLQGIDEDIDFDDKLDEEFGSGSAPSVGPSNEDKGKAQAKMQAKSKEKDKQKEAPQEEEQLPMQEGERIIEEMSTRDALDHLGVCPANFEWFELNPANPPDENCGICHYKLADGYRCGGGTHFVCMGCIDAYKVSGPQ